MADNWQLKAVISANAEGMLKTLKTVNAMSRTTRKYLGDVANAAGRLSGRVGLPFAALSAAFGGFSVLAVRRAVVDYTDLGEAIQNGSIKAGMSVQQYQRLAYVAEQSGTSIEGMTTNLASFNRRIGDASVGKNKALAGLMSRLGISIRDANGQVRSGIDLLPDLADAFQRNTNPVIRARLGMTSFGKAYAEILPLLVEGSQGIRDNLARFDRIRDVLGPDDVKAAKDLGDSFKDLQLVTKGFQLVVARELAPVVKPLVDNLVAWWVANKKLVGTEVAKMAKDLAAYIKTIDFRAVIAGVGEFFRGVSQLVEMVGGAKNALIALAVVMNLQTILAAWGLVAAIGRLTIGLGTLAVSAIPQAVLASTMLTTAWTTASTVGLGLLAIMTKVFAAAAVGYGVGTLLNNYAVNPAVRKLSGDNSASLGTWLYNKFNQDENAAWKPPTSTRRPSLVGSPMKVQAGGRIQVAFDNAPPGLRFEKAVWGDIPFDVDVGYRSYSVGAP